MAALQRPAGALAGGVNERMMLHDDGGQATSVRRPHPGGTPKIGTRRVGPIFTPHRECFSIQPSTCASER
jgi:hypothetical protein